MQLLWDDMSIVISYWLTSGISFIRKVFQPDTITIAPNGSTNVKFKLEFSAGNAIKGWSTLIANALQKKDLPMDFIGTFKTKTLFGFLSVPVRYSTSGKNLYQLWKTYYG